MEPEVTVRTVVEETMSSIRMVAESTSVPSAHRKSGGALSKAVLDEIVRKSVASASQMSKAAIDDALRKALHVHSEASRAAEVSAPHFKSRAQEQFEAFFAGEHGSIRKLYVALTGDERVTGNLSECDAQRCEQSFQTHAAEAITSGTLLTALTAAVNASMVEAYKKSPRNIWRKLAKVTPVSDFRTQSRWRMADYGSLHLMNQGSSYLPLTTPGDFDYGIAAQYSVTKRGGTESITLEAIRNDNTALVRSVPTRLAEAAAETLCQFVLDFLRLNPVIYDGLPLFQAAGTRNNLGNQALSSVSFKAGYDAMRRQREYGSNTPLGIRGKYLWVPVELQELAYNLFVQGTNNERTWGQRLDVEVVPVWYWTDADDWALTCDPKECPTVEVGFLSGREDPEVFAQDLPSAGSFFSHDSIVLKIRHIYGGAVLDYRGVYKSTP